MTDHAIDDAQIAEIRRSLGQIRHALNWQKYENGRAMVDNLVKRITDDVKNIRQMLEIVENRTIEEPDDMAFYWCHGCGAISVWPVPKSGFLRCFHCETAMEPVSEESEHADHRGVIKAVRDLVGHFTPRERD